MPTHVDRYHMYWDTVLQQIFTVIKMGKKYKNSFLGRKKTPFGILEIQFLKLSHCWEILGNILKLFLAIIFGVRCLECSKFKVNYRISELCYNEPCYIEVQMYLHPDPVLKRRRCVTTLSTL